MEILDMIMSGLFYVLIAITAICSLFTRLGILTTFALSFFFMNEGGSLVGTAGLTIFLVIINVLLITATEDSSK